MAIHTEEVEELSGGFTKEIEASAMGMIMDNLQVSQYNYPVKSTIRELVSNAVDAVRERNVALSIISGQAKEEDHYIRRDDPLYKDSNFNPEYYEPVWLSTNDTVLVSYREGGTDRDFVHIIDEGVGLGGKRLEGYFKLGYSSKRNTSKALGKFGIGAKAALSTNVDFYTVFTRYNGMEFGFNVYSHKVDSIIPPMDLDTGLSNPSYTFSNGYVAHYRSTTRKNGTEVIIETKKHKKQEYLDAVKSQLLYFNNVELEVVKSNGFVEKIPVKANVLFENEYLIISENFQYSKPHLVINGVSYGYVDFQELELEQRSGNVGIKVSAEEVKVTPSRESVIWSDLTKKTVQKRFRQAVGTATSLIQEKLKTDDFIDWLRTWLRIRRNYVNRAATDVISRLSGIINMEELEPAFSKDTTLKAGSVVGLFPGMRVQHIQVETKSKGGKKFRKLVRESLTTIQSMNPELPILITDEKPPVRTVRWLATQHQQGFYLIQYPKNLEWTSALDAGESEEEEDNGKWLREFSLLSPAEHIKKAEGLRGDAELSYVPLGMGIKAIIEILKKRRERVVKVLNESTQVLRPKQIIVPESFDWNNDEEEELSEVEAQEKREAELSPEERRKLEEKVVLFTPRGFVYQPSANEPNTRLYQWQKIEPKLKDVQSLEGEEIYYGTSKDEELIHLTAAITRPYRHTLYGAVWGNSREKTQAVLDQWGVTGNIVDDSRNMAHWGPDASVLLMKVAQDQVKHYRSYKHVSEFYQRLDGKTITMSDKLVNWHTARLIHERIQELAFLNNFDAFDPVRSQKYRNLVKFYEANYRDISDLMNPNPRNPKNFYFGMNQQTYETLIGHHNKVAQLQLFIRKNPEDTEAIAEMSKALFDTELEGAQGLNLQWWDIYNELLDYAQPIHRMLNEIDVLKQEPSPTLVIDSELETEIRFYLSSKGL